MEIIFWVSILFMAFVYAGYGIAIWLANKIRGSKTTVLYSVDELPELAVLIAAYNEEDIIKEKLNNTLSLNYPKEKLKIYVITDGSNDKTNEIVKSFSEAELLFVQSRKGKTAAINRAMPYIKEPVTIFTDANVMLNADAFIEIVKHYADKKIGGVSGEKRVALTGSSAAATEGLYWKYESFLKNEDAKLNSLVGAAGELFSIRTALFQPLPEDTLLDDFMISMNIIRKGFKIAYEPGAYASENPSLNIKEEYKRKVRISAGGLQSVLRLIDFINPANYGLLSFQYFFHRFSRWIITPFLIPLAFIANTFIAAQSDFYAALLVVQILFHAAALLGYYFESKSIRIKLLFIPFYFNFMHYCIVAGWVKYLSGNQQAAWQKASRLATVQIIAQQKHCLLL
jgi:cellulose synthase/poly-beta-1,6-N-acetylglucosamine synthase-like glycosyltransferase